MTGSPASGGSPVFRSWVRPRLRAPWRESRPTRAPVTRLALQRPAWRSRMGRPCGSAARRCRPPRPRRPRRRPRRHPRRLRSPRALRPSPSPARRDRRSRVGLVSAPSAPPRSSASPTAAGLNRRPWRARARARRDRRRLQPLPRRLRAGSAERAGGADRCRSARSLGRNRRRARRRAATDGLVDPTVGRTLRLAGYDRTLPARALRDGDAFRPSLRAFRAQRGRARRGPARRARAAASSSTSARRRRRSRADRARAAAAARFGGGVLVSASAATSPWRDAPAGGWPVRVADDHAAPLDAPGPEVAIATGGLATSGTAVRRWRAGAVELHHIVDPRTGRPADDALADRHRRGRARASRRTSRARPRSCSARRARLAGGARASRTARPRSRRGRSASAAGPRRRA